MRKRPYKRRKSLKERFDGLVMPISESGCLIWMSSLGNNGYGRIRIDGKIRLPHRLSWELHYGEIPKGMCVCHKCDIPSCVNPNHLFLGSRKDNTQDMLRKNRNAVDGENLSKLTIQQVIEIKKKLNRGISNIKIAAEYNVTPTAISCIRLRKAWASVNV